MTDYAAFLARKSPRFQGDGIPYIDPHGGLFPFQRDLIERALDRGRYALFADCGMGKTFMQLEWASRVPGRVLLLAPLGVGAQTEAEARRFGFDAAVATSDEPAAQITITNYERLHRFSPDDFAGIVLDESSILKAHTGKTRNALIAAFGAHKYRLACTATPSPNDFMELGNHAEFLGAMTRSEMLSMFFVHDGGSTQDWRLKGHAKRDFWRWVASWASVVRRPSDMGYDDAGFVLPPLRFHRVEVDGARVGDALIPGVVSLSLTERRQARRESMTERVSAAAEIAAHDDSPVLVWCDLNDESKALARAIPGAVEVTGADSDEHKRDTFLAFARGELPGLVTKPRIGGWGMNWQACHRMIFCGLSDSYEALYQATRRCWRFGQTKPVDVFLVYSHTEHAVVENVLRKERQHDEMQESMLEAMR